MWVAIDKCEGEFEIFNTKKEAIKWCDKRISDIRNWDGWRDDEDMQGIQVAKIKYRARQENKQTKEEWEKRNPDGQWPDVEWNYICEYEMKKLRTMNIC
jgi:hypothetical protein